MLTVTNETAKENALVIRHRLNSRLLLLALAGIVLYMASGLLMGILNKGSIDEDIGKPAVSREAAKQAALTFVSDRFTAFETGKTDVTHQSDQMTSSYLKRYELQKVYAGKLPIQHPLDYWQVEILDRTGKSAITVRVSMDKATVTGWSSTGSSPEPNDAAHLRVAADALTRQGFDPKAFTPGSPSGEPSIYLFESKQPLVGAAKMNIKVEVSQNQAVTFLSGFTVPKTHSDWMQKQKSAAAIMSYVSLGLSGLLGITALILAIRNRRDIRFSRGWLLMSLFAVLFMITNLNVLPGVMVDTQPSQRDMAKIFIVVFTFVVMLLTVAGQYFSLLAGDQMWRRAGWNPWPRMTERRFGEDVVYGMGRGYLICLFVLGLQQMIFVAESGAFHSFSVNDPTQSVYNIAWPALFPLLAWVAAISEEITFRLFGIALFKKIVRFTFPAVLIPNIIWALGHTGYAIYPTYSRLIEVTILGFVFSYTFLKYGLITAIFAHATLDGSMTAISLIVSYGTPKSFI
jgi:hypothetical protein